MFTEPKLTKETFLLVAMRHYDNLQCTSLAEFEEDLKRFGYLKKLFIRYKEDRDLKERLILNHITVLFNLFGVATVEMLFFKIDKEYWGYLATFLLFLDRMPEEIPEFGIKMSDLNIDSDILTALRNL